MKTKEYYMNKYPDINSTGIISILNERDEEYKNVVANTSDIKIKIDEMIEEYQYLFEITENMFEIIKNKYKLDKMYFDTALRKLKKIRQHFE